jgi:hypothetical protein
MVDSGVLAIEAGASGVADPVGSDRGSKDVASAVVIDGGEAADGLGRSDGAGMVGVIATAAGEVGTVPVG